MGRVWRLFVEEGESLAAAVADCPSGGETRRALHRTIRKVSADIESLDFNTAISALMEFCNHLGALKRRPAAALRDFLLLLAPFAPHIAEELWERLRGGFPALVPAGMICAQRWPECAQDELDEAQTTIVVQINGKLRARLQMPSGASRDALERAALAAPSAQAHLAGRSVRKLVVVPGRLVNIVVA